MACEVKTGFCVLIFVLYAGFSQVAATKCLYASSCPGTQHFCRRNNVCRNNCINEPCSYSGECALGEYCCDGKCTLNCSSCSYDHHCLSGETCCGPSSVGENLNSTCGKYCSVKLCVDDSDCSGSLHNCCAGVCRIGCSFCHINTECSSSEACCGRHLYNKGHCAKSCVNSCKLHFDCPPGQFCCGPGKVGKCATSCVGKSCKNDYRCASGESCCSDGKCAASCIGKTCDGTSDCATGEYCCDRANGTGKCASSCVGKSCKYESHCATRECCCGNAPSYLRKCAKSCIGISCTYNSECASGESCSSNKKCVLSWRRKHCIFEKDCAQGGSCHSRLCVQICTNRKQCGLSEFSCSFQEIWGMCRTSCLGISCQSDQDCASGEHCSGTYNKVCSRTHTAQACYTNGDCSTGQCCDDDRNCTTGACDSKKMDGTSLFIAVFVGTPFAIILVCICLSICLKQRKGPRESTESIGEAHENIQLSLGRTLEQPEVDEEQLQHSQLQSLNIENLRQCTNPPAPPYPDQPPPLYQDQPPPPYLDQPPPPHQRQHPDQPPPLYPDQLPPLFQDQPPPAYSTLSLSSSQHCSRISPPPYQS